MDENKKGVYKFHVDMGRQGELEGIFVAEASEIEEIIGKDVYFGEVLGKHSDVGGEIEEDEITLITDDPVVVEVFEKHKLRSGINPLGYYYDQKEEE